MTVIRRTLANRVGETHHSYLNRDIYSFFVFVNYVLACSSSSSWLMAWPLIM